MVKEIIKVLFAIIVIASSLLFSACSSEESSNTNREIVVEEIDSLSLITHHIVNDLPSLVLALEIADDFDTITIVDRIDCAEPLIILNKSNLLINGDYAEICLAGIEESIIVIDSCHNLTIEGLQLYYTNNTGETPAIMHIKSGKNIVIKNNHIHNSGSYGIKVEKMVDSLAIISNTINNCNKFGVYSCAENTCIEGNTFYNNRDGFSDFFLCKNIINSCESDSNIFLVANYHPYTLEVEELVFSGVYSEKEYMSPEGIEKIRAYFDNEMMIYLNYFYSEEHSDEFKVFFNKGKLVFIKQTTIDYQVQDSIDQNIIINEYSYINGKLVKWEQIVNNEPKSVVSSDDYPKKHNELNITVNTLVGMIPSKDQEI